MALKKAEISGFKKKQCLVRGTRVSRRRKGNGRRRRRGSSCGGGSGSNVVVNTYYHVTYCQAPEAAW